MRKRTEFKMITLDPQLRAYESDINMRMERLAATEKAILGKYADLSSFANGYLYFGFHRTEDGWVYREWAPAAEEMHLIGDFNFWNRTANPMTRITEGGVWEIKFKGKDALKHGQRVKVCVKHNGQSFDRIPLYITKVCQDENHNFSGQIWDPATPFHWTDGGYRKRSVSPLTIYEAHIGMAQEEERIGTYDEFTDNILPRIKQTGYNTVQLMAIMEHPYYASFGYQVSNFFAPSCWYGEPEGLKRLINTAHEMGMFVLLDIVHSHACSNALEGIASFDGTQEQFFHAGERGHHSAWGTCVFNYGKHEVIHFLLSNIKYWLEEFHFDGFRFDGVTSMLYLDHGLGSNFDNYKKYYSMNTDI
ncbi:MAG: 1,4-alpha-glucan-branching enzyme, partial [Clostridia bacterium]|nr:1,4-alpha-glucan-branching enzyme [Clostridia bacterium]